MAPSSLRSGMLPQACGMLHTQRGHGTVGHSEVGGHNAINDTDGVAHKNNTPSELVPARKLAIQKAPLPPRQLSGRVVKHTESFQHYCKCNFIDYFS